MSILSPFLFKWHVKLDTNKTNERGSTMETIKNLTEQDRKLIMFSLMQLGTNDPSIWKVLRSLDHVIDERKRTHGRDDVIRGKLKDLRRKIATEDKRIDDVRSKNWEWKGKQQRDFVPKLRKHIGNKDGQAYFWTLIERYKDVIRIGEFSFEVDPKSGSIYLTNPDESVLIYCSPYWEGESGIGIEIHVEGMQDVVFDVNSVFMGQIPFEASWNPVDDLIRFLDIMDKWIKIVRIFE